MKRIIVRYRVKPHLAAENQALIERVFDELQRSSPPGLRYASFKQDDGVSFVHIAAIETENGENPLPQSPAFQAFQMEPRARCDEQPIAAELEEIGSYRSAGL